MVNGTRPLVFPFPAIVGQEAAKRALLLAVVNPRVGGVLLLGEKGTAKTTAVRGLAAVLPEIAVVAGCPSNCDPGEPALCCPRCREARGRGQDLPVVRRPVPVVELPLSADLERLVGTVRLDEAVREGRACLEPGLLAAANRGILYVDEINLLPAHLAEALLDAAASGVQVVQREGLTAAHPARFLLVGTMNPEEGDLRPQLLDRFGLAVAVEAERDARARAEVVRRRLAFEEDPPGFVRAWAREEERLRRSLAAARDLLPAVRVGEPALARAVELAKWAGAPGHRGDIVLVEAARALAAWRGRTLVRPEDVEAVSELVLLHRLPRREPRRAGAAPDARAGAGSRQDTAPPGDGGREAAAGRPVVVRTAAGESVPAGELRLPARRRAGRGGGAWSGRSARVRRPAGGGRYVRAVAHGSGDLAVDATVRAAAPHQRWRPRREGVALAIEPGDLRWKVRERRIGSLLLFVVDGSGSMAGRRRIVEARSAVVALLRDAYRNRDRVGVVVFRGERAEVVLPPTNSVELAQRRLAEVPTGGRTPLAAGLLAAGGLALAHRRACPAAPVRVVLLTDGRANAGLGGDPWQDALRAAEVLRGTGADLLFIDVEKVHPGSAGRNRHLAEILGAGYVRIEELRAERLLEVVRGWKR